MAKTVRANSIKTIGKGPSRILQIEYDILDGTVRLEGGVADFGLRGGEADLDLSASGKKKVTEAYDAVEAALQKKLGV